MPVQYALGEEPSEKEKESKWIKTSFLCSHPDAMGIQDTQDSDGHSSVPGEGVPGRRGAGQCRAPGDWGWVLPQGLANRVRWDSLTDTTCPRPPPSARPA